MFQKQSSEVSHKKVILKISQKLQKNTQLGGSLLTKLQVLGLQLKAPTQLFSSEFWESFKNTFYLKHYWVAASESLSSSKYASLLV